ncbi:hypothetical protein [Acanthopleuribacter pedis]|uniref:Uncharacterized protein n=1 Tax=Acanthopleuribacter pedis TaxID=442870 RepID=A0A8J7QBG7_9BACT|nr:hypothetical protein [Acanthopleuribacter pedis]MBO1321387.1 hypothetical protein [Acanthopleuribacter pedis]
MTKILLMLLVLGGSQAVLRAAEPPAWQQLGEAWAADTVAAAPRAGQYHWEASLLLRDQWVRGKKQIAAVLAKARLDPAAYRFQGAVEQDADRHTTTALFQSEAGAMVHVTVWVQMLKRRMRVLDLILPHGAQAAVAAGRMDAARARWTALVNGGEGDRFVAGVFTTDARQIYGFDVTTGNEALRAYYSFLNGENHGIALKARHLFAVKNDETVEIGSYRDKFARTGYYLLLWRGRGEKARVALDFNF